MSLFSWLDQWLNEVPPEEGMRVRSHRDVTKQIAADDYDNTRAAGDWAGSRDSVFGYDDAGRRILIVTTVDSHGHIKQHVERDNVSRYE